MEFTENMEVWDGFNIDNEELDLDKIKTVDDIKAVFNALGFNFVGNHPRINMIAHLLDRNNPIYPPKEFEVETDLSKLDEIENEIAE